MLLGTFVRLSFDLLCKPEAGYTGISVGKVDERYVMLPIHSIVDKGARKVGWLCHES